MFPIFVSLFMLPLWKGTSSQSFGCHKNTGYDYPDPRSCNCKNSDVYYDFDSYRIQPCPKGVYDDINRDNLVVVDAGDAIAGIQENNVDAFYKKIYIDLYNGNNTAYTQEGAAIAGSDIEFNRQIQQNVELNVTSIYNEAITGLGLAVSGNRIIANDSSRSIFASSVDFTGKAENNVANATSEAISGNQVEVVERFYFSGVNSDLDSQNNSAISTDGDAISGTQQVISGNVGLSDIQTNARANGNTAVSNGTSAISGIQIRSDAPFFYGYNDFAFENVANSNYASGSANVLVAGIQTDLGNTGVRRDATISKDRATSNYIIANGSDEAVAGIQLSKAYNRFQLSLIQDSYSNNNTIYGNSGVAVAGSQITALAGRIGFYFLLPDPSLNVTSSNNTVYIYDGVGISGSQVTALGIDGDVSQVAIGNRANSSDDVISGVQTIFLDGELGQTNVAQDNVAFSQGGTVISGIQSELDLKGNSTINNLAQGNYGRSEGTQRTIISGVQNIVSGASSNISVDSYASSNVAIAPRGLVIAGVQNQLPSVSQASVVLDNTAKNNVALTTDDGQDAIGGIQNTIQGDVTNSSLLITNNAQGNYAYTNGANQTAVAGTQTIVEGPTISSNLSVQNVAKNNVAYAPEGIAIAGAQTVVGPMEGESSLSISNEVSNNRAEGQTAIVGSSVSLPSFSFGF